MTEFIIYGDLKVTSSELEAAKTLSLADDPMGEAAYQLVRYCRDQIHVRTQAEEVLRMIRAERSA